MQKIVHNIDIPLIQPFNSNNIMFLDIETNGLSHKHKLVIIGLVVFTPQHKTGQLIQLFNEDFNSERDMLDALRTLIKTYDIDYFISFNGNAFDFPFLNARFKHYKMDYSLPKSANIDILRIARSHHHILGLRDLKLKSVESAVGIDRTDIISGKDSIVLYDAYLESRSDVLRSTILLHNYDDLVNMVPLLKLTASIPFNLPDYMEYRSTKIYLATTRLKGSMLECTLELSSRVSILDLFYETSEIRFECSNASVKLDIECKLMKDSSGNIYHFIHTDFAENKPFEETSDDEKRHHLAFINKSFVNENAATQIFRVCKALLDLLLR